MKKFKIILIIIFCATNLMAQGKFPSRDSKEWNKLTVAQRWQAVNLPEDQLYKMTTNDLIEHCINFSFMWDIFNYPSYGIGLDIVIEHHNGLRELLNRKDAGKLILDFYNKIELNRITEMSKPIDRGKLVAQVFFLELFLSHPKILNQFKGNERKLIKSILSSHETCLEINTKYQKIFYSGYSIRTKILAIGREFDSFEVTKANNQVVEQLDQRKLTDRKYKELIEKAKEF